MAIKGQRRPRWITITPSLHTVRENQYPANLCLLLFSSMGGREASLEAKAKSVVSDAKAEAGGIAAQAETLAADAKAKTGQVVDKVKGKLS